MLDFVNEMVILFYGCFYMIIEFVKNINDNIFYNLFVKRLQIYKYQLIEILNFNIVWCIIFIYDFYFMVWSCLSIFGEFMYCVSNRFINQR